MGQLTLEQRYQIQSCIDTGMNQTQTADYLGRNKSVICRELKRNSDKRSSKYTAKLADKKANHRHKTKLKRHRFTSEIQVFIERYLAKDYSPEQIVGKAILEEQPCVSIERIYQHIWSNKKKGGTLYKHLRTQGKRYRKRSSAKDSRGLLTGRIDIDERPDIVEEKQRLGDLEIDLVVGKDHKGALLTINDRVTGVLFMTKVESKHAAQIECSTIDLLEQWKPIIHTITSDNGKEFANHQSISKELEIDFYFAKPYHSWQRGANENLNGLIRQYFPKGLDFRKIQNHQILTVQNILNNRPRKRFGFKSPNEMFTLKLDQLSKVAFIT